MKRNEDIRKYGISGASRILTLPRDALFLGVSYGVHGAEMFFQHQKDWSKTECWNIRLLSCDECVYPDMEYLGMLAPNGVQPPLFLYRIKEIKNDGN
jgi:hypothetical protein